MPEVGHIFITGQIGTKPSSGGQPEVKGVELLDVVEQVANLPNDVENIHVHINSPGGFVTVGDSIAEFLSSLKKQNVFTIAEEMCASIATKIHLCVPLENRFIQENCKYVIHNPFVQNVSGDADQLTEMAASIKKTETDLESMYTKATGLDKAAIDGLMKIETGLTPEQCVNFKFAAKIVKLAPVVALIYKENEQVMDNTIKDRIVALVNLIPGVTVPGTQTENMKHINCTTAVAHPVNSTRVSTVALVLETDQGAIETPFADIMVGDPVMIDGEPAADNTYVLTTGGIEVLGESELAGEGTKIVVKGGFIESIELAAGAPVEDTVESLKAALTLEQGKTATLTTQNATLTGDLAQSNANAKVVLAELEKKGIKVSGYVPPTENVFVPKVDPVGKTMKEQMDEAKAKYKEKAK